MSYKNLQSFIDKLEAAGELKRIKVEVDADAVRKGVYRVIWGGQ